jgi:predicted nucleotidyltransferase
MSKTIISDALNHLVADLKATHGDNLSSVVLYGSAAAGDHVELHSDYNLLISLNRIRPDDLRLAQAPLREWQRLGHPLPVYFTVEELQDAADVFPIEFLHMETARVVLYGRDPFEFLQISDANLRHQTEYELRSKFIQLRRLYVPASVSAEKLCALLVDSLSSFASLFRPVLTLHGSEPPRGKPDAVRATAQLLKLDVTPFEQIFALRASGEASLNEKEANDLFADYMTQIERVIETVDRLGGNPTVREGAAETRP